MTHVVAEPCVGCLHADCVDACPVDCFHRDDEKDMLLIDPFECIDCGACIPVCPEEAIFPEDEVPPMWKAYVEMNAERAASLPLVATAEEVADFERRADCR